SDLESFGIEIGAIVDRSFSNDEMNKKDGILRTSVLSDQALFEKDVMIDFSSASAIIHRIETAARTQVPMVIGVTGWEKEKTIAKEIIEEVNGYAIASPNFSFSVQIFLKLVKEATNLFS